MNCFDVFNGDADGICALTQLRNAEPREATLVTGVKRDIQLLRQVDASDGDIITVLDVSMDKNRDALQAILEAGAEVFYCDHHFAGEIPTNQRLTALVDTRPEVCTSLLVNDYLRGAFPEWAVVGAFGDNLVDVATALGRSLGLDGDRLQQLRNLGVYVNYNGYGAGLEDLHFPPAELYRLVSPWANPLDFISAGREHFQQLEDGYRNDMTAAAALQPVHWGDDAAVFVLPNEAWARRVSGVYINELANRDRGRRHALVTEKANGNYMASVRAPLDNRVGADEFCMRFPTGGGRKAAAGVNDLPADQLEDFIGQFAGRYPSA